jgi:sugar phosphate isomerase/epimerase
MFSSHNILLQPKWDSRNEFYALAQENNFGLELLTFAWSTILLDPEKREKHITAYEQELSNFRGVKSLHGPFIDIIPHSPDPGIVAVARDRIFTALTIAERLKCTHIVFHTGINTLINHQEYQEMVTSTQAVFWVEALEKFPNLTICLENMWDTPAILKSILSKANHSRLKICFDCGHANVFSPNPSKWIQELAGHITYMHWNDNHGVEDTELAIGDGLIEWKNLISDTLKLPTQPYVVLEVGALEKVKKSIKYLKELKMLA